MCTGCSEEGLTYEDYINHRRKHNVEKSLNEPFVCPLCTYSTSYSTHFKRHLMSHCGLKPYKCSECKKCFLEKSKLRRHMDTHASGRGIRGSFGCGYCFRTYPNEKYLKSHKCINPATGKRPPLVD